MNVEINTFGMHFSNRIKKFDMYICICLISMAHSSRIKLLKIYQRIKNKFNTKIGLDINKRKIPKDAGPLFY
jgi:hypothetical protein